MSESKQRQFHTPELKAKVGLEAILGTKTINEIGLGACRTSGFVLT